MSDELVVAAHPDDEVLGCGGTIARRASEGAAVHVAILGEGATSRASQPGQAPREGPEALASNARAAGDRLGAASVSLFGLPDNRFDEVVLLTVVKLIEGLIEEHEPAIVYTQHGGDANVDHRVTFAAVLAATRPVPGHPVREVLAFPVGSSSDWAFRTQAPAFRPGVFVDISAHLVAKIAALECYPGELRPAPHPRSPEVLRATALYWGSAVGVAAAEPFEVVRSRR